MTNPIDVKGNLLLVFSVLAVDVEAAGPSFDCKKARGGSVEETVCQDAGQAALGASLAEVHNAASREAA